MFQKSAREYILGLKSFYHLSNSELGFGGGVALRVQDAVIAILGIKYKNIYFQTSYDINTSPLKNFTNGRGGLEFSVSYVAGKIKQ